MRVLTVLEILQARDHVSGSELAERLEVDLRTIQRYIVRLQDLRIPIQSVRGAGGFYRLRPGFRLPPLMFTEEEAFALTLGLRALRQLGLAAFAPATEGASAKLERVLPDALRESIQEVEDVIAVEPGPWVISTPAVLLMQMATAIRTRRRVHFAYRAHSGAQTVRAVDPYGIVHADGRWYAIGHDHARTALRTFRLDRVTELSLGTESFDRPAAFDPGKHLQAGLPFVESGFRIDVWIDLPHEEAQRVFAPRRVATEAKDGGTRVRCSRDRLELFAAMLLSFGRRIVVHEPAELRAVFAQIAGQATEAASTPEHEV